MTKCLCNNNSEYAYILKNKNDETINKITILNYIQNKELQNEIKTGDKYLVCKEKHDLIKYESLIKKCHFKHKSISLITDWHKDWQNNFEQKEIPIGNHIADVIVDNIIIEFQHSYISKEDVESRNRNSINNNKLLYWVIDCNDTIEVNKIGDILMIYFFCDFWKFEHFICHEFIFLHFEDKIYKVNPNEIKSNMIDVIECKTKKEFIKSIKNKINIWSEEEIPQCMLYHNQRGAGCGKTYESIQLMDKNEKFKHKNIFIYLTKAHTAKDVIYNELLEQYNRGSLNNLEIPEEGYNVSGKQYKINYNNKETENECKIIIGTIDSFMYAIGNKNTKDKDYFNGIVKSIKNGYVKTEKNGSIKYSQENIKLNKKCLIIIDEAQDLGPEYIEAICSIMRNTYIDAYIIGDKLQSIWGDHNIHTFLECNDLPHITIEKSDGKNHVMRFHNEHFKNFVNDIVDFDKYNLPHITEICNNSSCKYHHENNIKPYNIFQIPSLRSDDKETQVKMDKLIKKIIYYMDSEIIKYNYLPNNFMFIFPILTKNFFANRLEAKIQEFWMEKFNDENYQNNVLVNNKYWEKRINKKKAYKYIFLHKSDEGKSIDLRESENATRILSIHASKGNGCEVIFVFGLNQKALQIFSKDKCNLQYDSLLHVALTRQKKSLYIGIENINDDIAQKFEKYIEIDNELKPDLNDIKKSIKYNKIIDFSCNSDNLFLNIYDKYLSSTELVNILPDNQDNKNIIEWGHHIIRYCVFYYYLKFNIINNEKIDDEHIDETNNSFRLFQFTEVLNKISKLKLKFELHNKYYKKINYICDDNTFYILEFTTKNLTKYNNYKDTLFNFIKNIQEKISKSIKEKKIPFLCPLETVILLHMIKLYDDGKYSDITIMDVYSIIYYFDECSNSIDENHSNEYKCLCKKHFNENNNSDDFNKYQEIRESIINHYMKTEQIKILYENYKKYITEKLSTSKFKYNIFHPVVLYNDHSNFKITNNFELIANSDEYIIDFIITPQFNKLNFNNIMLKSIFNNFLLQNIYNKHKNNLERYANKIIYTCILSLDSNEPIFIKLNIDKNCNIIKNSIENYLLNDYIYKHKTIYNFYQYCKKEKPTNSVKYTYKQIIDENITRYALHISEIPKYIENYFYDIVKELDKKDKNIINDIKIKLSNQELFFKDIKIYLEQAIYNFNNYEDEENDIDF
jgi:hypothetical protein